MTDTYTDPNSTYGTTTSGTLMPQVAAAYARDPRRLLAQSLIAQGQQATSRPSYSTFSALANALTGAASGVAPTILNNEYKQQNQQVMDAMRSAYGVGAPASPATGAAPPSPQTPPNPPGGAAPTPAPQSMDQQGQPSAAAPALAGAGAASASPAPTAPRPPVTQYELTAHAFLQSNNPILVQQGVQMMQNLQQMQLKQSSAARDELLKQGLGQTGVDANGNPIAAPIAGYGAGKASNAGLIKGAETSADIAAHTAGDAGLINARSPAEAAAAAAKAQAENAPLIARAGGITAADLAAQARGKPAVIAATAGPEAAAAAQKAAATAPIETFKSLFAPLVDRQTGEVTIPGMDANLTAQVMARMGVKPSDLAGQPSATNPLQAPQNPGAPASTPNAAAPAPTTPGNPAPITAPVVVPPVGQGPVPTAKPAPPVPYGTKSPSDEVPTVGLPTGLLPKGPGTIIQGRDPVAIAAGEGAVKQADEQYHDTQEAAKGAGQVHSQVGTMISEVQNGGFTPSATAPGRAFLSGALNAAFGPDIAKSVTGLDPASTDVVSSTAGRMGLTYARQTEGAREALGSIQIALKANPQIAQSEGGFVTLLKLLDAGTQHDLAAQQYGDAFFNKNSHYVGFQGWMNQNHPPAEFTSKVVPYNLPAGQNGSVDPSQLQPNVTYNLTSKNYAGPAIWTGNGFKPAQ